MSEIEDFGTVQLKTFRNFSEKISAIYYHKGKIAIALASTYQRIEIWNYSSNKRELFINTNGLVSRFLKFDDSIIMSMFEEIRSWDLPSGKCNTVFKGGALRCCSFDYCKESNIVVGSFSDPSIYIWNLSTGEELKRIAQEHCSIQKVSLHPVISDEPQIWNTVNLLVLKDKEVDLWTVKFNPSDMQADKVMIDKCSTVRPYCYPLKKTSGDPKINTSCLKNEFLYYLESSTNVLDNKIVVWDTRLNSFHREYKVNRMVKNLLAVGSEYIALQTQNPSKNQDSFVVIDKMFGDEVIDSQISSQELQHIGADCNPPVIIGDTSWLDDLSEENGEDILSLCVCNREIVKVFKRGQSDVETLNESTGYCSLL